MNAHDFVGGNYITKDTLQAGAQRFLITGVETASFDGKDGSTDRRLQLVLDGEKRLTVNATNTRLLIKAFGADTAAWIGKRITLYVDETVTFRGLPVGGVRVALPKKPVPAPPPVEFDDIDFAFGANLETP